ncbi:FG-GAP repeat protein [Fibrella forsythiae]|uniref:FG-GAP repeat protein n=1 Tax=Fibrella forsythiae TaxID=2817061 RepID=A0ABS3JIY9_9BACT|nr:FG-GAP repeat protein [Fibrella forsythiae]MBO0949975.1 FG-GAP repeat protein [Fibrella forsythiae]
MKLLLQSIFLALFLTTQVSHAQIGINGSAHPSAALDVKSPGNDKAFYPPRLTSAQRKAIANPQAGAFVYDTDKGAMYLYDGQNWLPLVTTTSNLASPASRTASDGGGYDYFGSSVAISGDYAVVGAPTKSMESNVIVGAAYVFVRSGNGWNEQQKLMASDWAEYNRFGQSVAVSDNYIIVGASGKAINGITQGAVYVFTRSGSTWSQQQRLLASDGAGANEFGRSVSLSGDYLLVGAPGKNVGNNSAQGAAYVFLRSGTTWTEQQRLVAIDGAASDYFGSSLAIDGTTTAIGAYNKTVNSNSSQGAAYVFTRSGNVWSQQQKLLSSDGASTDYFGGSVALSGDYIVVGAYGKTFGSNYYQGAVYGFNRSGSVWSQQQQFKASDGAMSDYFGTSVTISGNYIMIGAPGKAVGSNTGQGAAYFFKVSYEQFRVTDLSAANTRYGHAVGLSNGTYIIGSNFGVGKVFFGTVD